MRILEDGRIQCRVEIKGEHDGRNFTYIDPIESDGSQFIWPRDNEDGWLGEQETLDKMASRFWWEDGNMSCDCNRWSFLPDDMKQNHNRDCGHSIKIFSITPIEGDNLPVLILNTAPFPPPGK